MTTAPLVEVWILHVFVVMLSGAFESRVCYFHNLVKKGMITKGNVSIYNFKY